MKKFAMLLLLIVLSTLIAGLYGALHDQITYTICPEYFTVFKFDQFGFQDWGHQTPRLTTALIGFLATWWVGFGIGIFQSLVGLFHKNHRLMFKYVLNAILITLGVAMLFAVAGFVYGSLAFSSDNIDCCFPYEIVEKRDFEIVGAIHNFGYIGGEIGAVVGLVYQIIKRKADTSKATSH